jgi:hypothetical protein
MFKGGDTVVAKDDCPSIYPNPPYKKGDVGVIVQTVILDPLSPVEGMSQVYVHRTGRYAWARKYSWRNVNEG